ncbi:MAG TPA: protein kinase [Actinocatenispora sp.]
MTTPSSPPSGDRFQAPSDSRGTAGAVVGGRYTLHEPIGAGGMGAVWRAHDDLLRRDVAVKEVLLPPGIPADERAALYERTLREARAAASLSHPSVVRMYDVINDNERPWLVMELLQARSVADMISRNGPLNPRAIAKIGLSVLGALEAAHSAGVLHRDVKPANVLICSDGRVVLTDFGVARIMTDTNAALTTPGMVLGSPQYISPERAMGADFGPPSDLFSLGVTLYTAAEGTPPFDRGDPLSTMHAVVYEDPEPPRNAGPLAPILHGLLVKDPQQRWGVDRARDELRAALAGPLSGNPGAYPQATSAMPTTGAPVSGAPMSAQPMSGQPMSGQPMSGPPMSGAPMSGGPAPGQPMSGQPMSGPPMSGPPMSGGPAPGAPAPYGAGPGTPMRRGMAQVPAPAEQYDVSEYAEGYADHGYSHAPARRRLGPWLVAGAAAVVAIVIVAIALSASGVFSGSDESNKPKPAAENAVSGTKISNTEGGYSTVVPNGWERKSGGGWEYGDPADKTAWIRFKAGGASGTAGHLLRSYGDGLQRNRSYQNYHQIALRQGVTMAGHNGAELEYTLVSGGQARHALWRVVIVDGTAYEVYLSVPADKFQHDRAAYRNAVKAFRIG